MTNTNVAATNISLLSAWWMNKNLRFNIAMGSIIMILNIKAIFYIKTQKISVDIDHAPLLPLFTFSYIVGDLLSCLFWVSAITEVKDCQGAYVCGLTGHITGFVVFIHLLSFISSQSALYVGLIFGLCMLPFVAVMMGPCLSSCVQEVQDWWEFVNQPGGYPISQSSIESLGVCSTATTNPSLLRAWWMNKNLRFDVAMSSIIMILNIGAIAYLVAYYGLWELRSSGLLDNAINIRGGAGSSSEEKPSKNVVSCLQRCMTMNDLTKKASGFENLEEWTVEDGFMFKDKAGLWW
ncbi:unnamed protein product [Arabis nemorensis]|uniref:Uncharacterized protein n=1 Tax=Arabis nemorensis TaxID=586526 RepID=A0A565BIJ7_9BRAS|nr:unnamed protein product [Arabis nemorensis]